MLIHKLMKSNGELIQVKGNIAKEVCEYYQTILTGKTERKIKYFRVYS